MASTVAQNATNTHTAPNASTAANTQNASTATIAANAPTAQNTANAISTQSAKSSKSKINPNDFMNNTDLDLYKMMNIGFQSVYHTSCISCGLRMVKSIKTKARPQFERVMTAKTNVHNISVTCSRCNIITDISIQDDGAIVFLLDTNTTVKDMPLYQVGITRSLHDTMAEARKEWPDAVYKFFAYGLDLKEAKCAITTLDNVVRADRMHKWKSAKKLTLVTKPGGRQLHHVMKKLTRRADPTERATIIMYGDE